MKTIYLLCLLFFACATSYAQEPFIIVYEGDVNFTKPSTSPSFSIGTRYAVPKNSAIKYSDNSHFIVFTKTKFFEKKEDAEHEMDYNTMLKNLKNNMGGSFWKLLHDYHQLTELGQTSFGGSIAGTKGLNDKKGKATTDDQVLSPEEFALITTQTVKLKWSIKDKVPGARMMVVHKESGAVIYNEPGGPSGEIEVALEQNGSYDWYLFSKLENKKRINRTFVKLSEADAKKMSDELNALKKDMAPLTPELQQIMLQEFLEMQTVHE